VSELRLVLSDHSDQSGLERFLMAIMTPEHPLWDEFVARLDAALVNGCDDTEEKPLTRAILERMPNIDIEASLAWFEHYDGYCDCEVLYHVATKWQLLMEAHWNN
jgi:hypothetical protein